MGTILSWAFLASLQASGLQGYWPLESVSGSSPDLSGNGNTLTVSGPTALSPGAFGNAAFFDNTDDQMTAANSASLNVGTGSFTVAAFIRPSGTSVDRIVNKWNGMGWLFDINETTGGTAAPGNLRMRVSDGTNNLDYSTGAGFVAGTWYHIAGVVDRTAGNLRLYVNGSQIGSSQALPAGLGNLSNTALLGLGNIPSTAGNWYGGGLDEVRLYSRALNNSEISALSNGVPGPVLNSATGLPGGVDLEWTAPAAGANSYTILSSSTSGGGYTTLASGVTGTTYTDHSAGTTAPTYYIVVADSSLGSSLPSNERSATAFPNQPRYNDHSEGARDGQCGCGAAAFAHPGLALAGVLLAAGIGLRRRRL